MNRTVLALLSIAALAACSSSTSSGGGSSGGDDFPTVVTISEVSSGSLVVGGSVTVTGTGFGTKATAAPVIFDDFESGSNGDTISTAAGWDAVDGFSEAAGAHTRKPFYSNTHKHAGNLGMTCNFEGDTGNSSVRADADYSNGFYLDAWYQYAPASPASRNNKLFLLYGSGENEFPQTALTGFCHLDEGLEIPFYAGPNDGDADWTGLTFNDLLGELHHLQVWIKPSTPGERDGKTWLAVDGTVHADSDDLLTNMPGVGHWVQARIGFYNAHDTVEDCVDSGDAHTYWDDIYIDDTPARVELGNAPVYDDCTHREIQIPTEWSETDVSFTVNPGTFAPGDEVYLFVVNGGGVVSAGHALTLD